MKRNTNLRRTPLSSGLVLEYRQRATIEAFNLVCARHGYHEVTIDLVAATAGVPCNSVYEQFGDKELLLLASLEQSAAAVLWESERACKVAGRDSWDRVKSGLEAILAWVDREGDASRVFLYEYAFAGPVAARIREKTLSSLTSALEGLLPADTTDPEMVSEFAVGGIVSIVRSQVLSSAAADVPALAGELVRVLRVSHEQPFSL